MPTNNETVFVRLIIALSILGAIVNAQAAESGIDSIEEIIVTARKRVETLQDAPVSISVLQAEQLEAIGAVRLSDVASRLPNVTAGYGPSVEGMSFSPRIRGISTDSRNIGFDSGYGIFIDGAYAGRNASSNKILPDVERIEFLPGPQATLFGKNTTVAVMNIVTRKPGKVWDGNVSVSSGNLGHRETRGVVRGPISDAFGIGLTVGTRAHDGYIRNTVDGSVGPIYDSSGGTLQLTADFDAVTADLLIDYVDQEWDNRYRVSRIEGWDAQPLDTHEGAFEETAKGHELGATLSVDFDIAGGTVSSITAMRDFLTDENFDDDAYALPVQEIDSWIETQDHVSQELRFASSARNTDYLLGAYYQAQDITSHRTANIWEASPDLMIAGEIETETVALFTNADIAISERAGVELGVRWSDEEKRMPLYSQTGGAPLGIIEFVTSADRNVDNTSYTGAFTYAFSDNVNSHIRYSRGFKSGGFNIDFVTFPSLTPLEFNDEFVDSYELGLKTQFLDRRLTANLALFHSEYRDMQVSQFTLLPGFELPVITITNAATSRSRGAELTLAYVTEPLKLDVAVGYTDAKITDFPNPSPQDPDQNHAGLRLEAPKWTFNSLAQYEIPIGSRSLELIGEYIFRDRQPPGLGSRDSDFTDDLHIVNLRARLHVTDQLTLSVWGENVADRRAVIQRSANFAQGFLQPVFGDDILDQTIGAHQPPRQWGIDLRYSF